MNFLLKKKIFLLIFDEINQISAFNHADIGKPIIYEIGGEFVNAIILIIF